MADWLIKDGVLFDHAAVAPSPCKDYHQLVVNRDQVILRWWRVSLRSGARATPSEVRLSHEDFLSDELLQSQICQAFGKNTLVYVQKLANGHIDYLPRLPDDILIHILRFLDLQDILRMSMVSKKFFEVCRSNALWELLYRDYNGKVRSQELHLLAQEVGWKHCFFTNKLQLQVQLRRKRKTQRQSAGVGEGDECLMSSLMEKNLNIASEKFSEGKEVHFEEPLYSAMKLQPQGHLKLHSNHKKKVESMLVDDSFVDFKQLILRKLEEEMH